MCKRIKSKAQTSQQGIDKCLQPFISILNQNGIKTKFSCCGHLATNPDIIFPHDKDIVELLKFLQRKTDCLDWIVKIENMGGQQFQVFFEAMICTPPQYPSWVDTPEEMYRQQQFRRNIGL